MTSKGSAGPSKTAPRGSADPPKTATMGSAGPSRTAPKGLAGPSKTVSLKDDSSPLRGSLTTVRVQGVLVDIEGFVHSRRSTSSSRPQVPPKPIVLDRQRTAERNF